MRCLTLLVSAAAIARGQQAPTPRPLGQVIATSLHVFGGVSQIRVLADGRVLVNDGAKRQLVLLDPQLGSARVVLDSVGGTDSSYGGIGATILAFRADSSLFTHMTSGTFLVLDPFGQPARSMAPPPGVRFSAAPTGTSWVPLPRESAWSDAFGFMHRSVIPPAVETPPPGAPDICVRLESRAVILGTDLATYSTDTLATYATGNWVTRLIGPDGVRGSGPGRQQLYPSGDRWVAAQDGSIAILRAQEYRVEWINADRTRVVGPRIPYDWKRLTDDERTAISDSINRERLRPYEERLANWIRDSTDAAAGRPAPPPPSPLRQGDLCDQRAAGVAAAGGGGASDGAGGGGGGGRGTGTGGGVSPPAAPTPYRIRPAPPTLAMAGDVPDYLPAVLSANRLWADANDNLWFRPRPAVPKSDFAEVYDVVNRRGELVERVEIPAGRRLVGFGPDRTVYVVIADAGTETLQRVRVR